MNIVANIVLIAIPNTTAAPKDIRLAAPAPVAKSKGDRWIIYIPYSLGYGNRASGPIPAFSTLIFEVELLGIA